MLKRLYRRILSFLHDLFAAVQADDIIPYAHQLTLSLILAFFPFIMFLFTLVGFLQINSALLLDPMQQALPASVYPFVADIITDVVDRQRGGLMSLSIIMAIYSASGGFRAFMKGSNRITGLDEHRPIVLRYIISIVWVILFALTLVIALLAMVFGRQIIRLLTQSWPHLAFETIINPLRLIVPVTFMIALLALFFMFGPAVRVRFRHALPGALFTTVVWVALTLIFQYYVDNFANYSRFYGTLGALIALLIWLQLVSTVLLFGVEINAVLMQRRGIELGKRADADPPGQTAG